MAKPRPTKPKPAPRATVFTVKWIGYGIHEPICFRIFSTREKADAWMAKYRQPCDAAHVSEIELDPESEHGR